MNKIINNDLFDVLPYINSNSIDCIISDIPYGISFDDWDILHNNTNSALLKVNPIDKQANGVFKKRGKPLNGWSKADKDIPIEYYNWCKSWAFEWFRILKPGATVFIFAGRRFSHRCISALEDVGFIFKDMLAWEKCQATYKAQRISCVFNRRNDTENSKKWEGWKIGNLRPLFEPILWFMKPYKIGTTLTDNVLNYGVGAFCEIQYKKQNKLCSNIIKVQQSNGDKGYHPTQKPIMLMEVLIQLVTQEKQTVLDPFCGSGSTLVAAERLNRNGIGIEKDKTFYDNIKIRLENYIEIKEGNMKELNYE